MIYRLLILGMGAAFCINAPVASAAPLLYGVTAADIITIDPLDPAAVTVVGPHGFKAAPYNLTYDPARHALLALTHDGIRNSLRRSLVQYDLTTGQSTTLATLHNIANGAEDALEYIDSRGNLFITRARSLSPHSIEAYEMDLTGTQTPIVTLNVPDNDAAIYDSVRDILYTIDANNVGRLMQIDLTTGIGAPRGPLPSANPLEGAYSFELDQIFIRDGATNALYVSNADPNHINFHNRGAINAAPVLGIAFVPIIISAKIIPTPPPPALASS